MSREADRINRDRIARAGHPEKPPLAGAQQFGSGADATLALYATGPEQDRAAARTAVRVILRGHGCKALTGGTCRAGVVHRDAAVRVREALWALGIEPDPVLPGSRPYQWGGRGGAG